MNGPVTSPHYSPGVQFSDWSIDQVRYGAAQAVLLAGLADAHSGGDARGRVYLG